MFSDSSPLLLSGCAKATATFSSAEVCRTQIEKIQEVHFGRGTAAGPAFPVADDFAERLLIIDPIHLRPLW